MARLPVLLPIVPELRRLVAVPEVVERSLEFTRAGNWPKWTARTAHGICDFVIACAGRTALAVEFTNWTNADTLDREFVEIVKRRAPRITLSFQQSGLRHANEEDDGPTLAASAKAYLGLAYYEAAIDAGNRALHALGLEASASPICEAVRAMVFGNMVLGRFEAVDALAADWLVRSHDPTLLAHICYAKAIMDVRLRDSAAHDLPAARRWVGKAIAHSEAMPPGRGRAVNLSFMNNTLALVEMREGNIGEARHLLDLAMEMLARDAPEAFATEGVVLLQNSARLYLRQGEPEKARGELDRLLALEPGNGNARADRARMKADEGDSAGAIADLDAAIAWEPPSADFHLQRGLIHFEQAHLGAAEHDARRALLIAPDEAQALCLLGLVRLRQGKYRASRRHFSQAIRADPKLADAWANRAATLLKLGHPRMALADLDRAYALRADPVIARNRERVSAILQGRPASN